MGQTLTIYALPQHMICGIGGSKRDDVYESLLTWDEKLNDIDEERKEAAEDWEEDASAILPSREALRQIVYDLEMDDQQSDIYALVVEFLCEVTAQDYFTDWHGRGVTDIFDNVEAQAKSYRKKLDALDLIFHGNPVKIPNDMDTHIGFWDHNKCRKNYKTLKKLVAKQAKKSDPEDRILHDRMAEMLNWLGATLKQKDGALVGILY